MRIRRAEAGDATIYDVCLRTADAGGGASALHVERDLPGDVWAGPYQSCAHLAFVAESHAGVDGYIVGAEDTVAFRAECEAQWWPALPATSIHPTTAT